MTILVLLEESVMGYLIAQPLLMNKTALTDFIVLMVAGLLTSVRCAIPLQTVQMCQMSVRGVRQRGCLLTRSSLAMCT